MFPEFYGYVRACQSCRRQSVHPSKPTGLLQPLDVPPFAWHTVTTDYITGLPTTPKGNNAIAVFVDKLTKYVYAVPCKDTSTAVDWASMYPEHVVQPEGLSIVIIPDRRPQFTSAFNKSLALRPGIGICLLHAILRLMVQTGSLRMSCVNLCHLT